MGASASYQYTANSLEETSKLATALAGWFQPGTVITLDGDLGAGKTAFSQAVAKAIGVAGVVSSPTFTIIKEYKGERLPFYHMDVYRLSLDEADDLGLDDYFYGDGITLIEWSTLIEELLPEERLAVKIELAADNGRVFKLIPYGKPYEQWCKQLKENGIVQ